MNSLSLTLPRSECLTGLADLDEAGYVSWIAMLIEDMARLEQLELAPEAKELLVRVYKSAAIGAVKTVCLVMAKARKPINWEVVGEIAEGEVAKGKNDGEEPNPTE
ncbi:MAG: hypothetical protein EHM23_21335 [Acidobacteria bacterium]|nr:MAG: hypothetical protein EHM23_21335 [Acidobacteriota bacterium]